MVIIFHYYRFYYLVGHFVNDSLDQPSFVIGFLTNPVGPDLRRGAASLRRKYKARGIPASSFIPPTPSASLLLSLLLNTWQPCPDILSSHPTTMTNAIVLEKPNIGVYTNTKHDLWVAESKPSVEEIKSGQGLKAGEVTVEVRSTGICGYELISPKISVGLVRVRLITGAPTDPTSISGTMAVSVP